LTQPAEDSNPKPKKQSKTQTKKIQPRKIGADLTIYLQVNKKQNDTSALNKSGYIRNRNIPYKQTKHTIKMERNVVQRKRGKPPTPYPKLILM
jgi:hypothetical protein